jgi:cytochrome P450
MSSFSTALTGVTYVPPAVLLSIITLTGLYAFYQWAFVPKPLPGIPYDCESAQKVMGDILALRADPEGLAAWSCKKLQRLQSPICQALMGPKIMGGQPIVLVADVDNVREAILSRSDFDRSSYLIDRFPLFGDFHLNLKTTDQWKLSRQWSKDLLNTQYMNGVAGPAIELAAKRLIELWDGKSRLAKGRPFSMRRDIMGVSIDVILAFYFGDDMADSILSREVELVKHLEGAELGAGEHNSIIFPEAELHEFPQGLLDLSHTITSLYTTLWPPTLAAFWTRWISPQSRRQISGKERAIRQWVARAVQRIKGGNRADIKSGLDHMVWREQLAANKTSRPSKHSKQIMLDEVRKPAFQNRVIPRIPFLSFC